MNMIKTIVTNRSFIESLIVAIFLTGLSYAVGFYFGWITEAAWLEVFAVLTSYSCTYLCVRQSRWNYPVGILGVFLYSVLFYQWGMIALAVFNLYLVGSLIYGYFRWGPDDITLPVTNVSAKGYAGYLLFGMLIALGFYGAYIMLDPSGASTVNMIDVGLAAASGVAQLMLDRKKLQTWFVWTGVNVVSIPFFFSAGMYLVAFQYIFFLLNAMYGWYEWRKTMPRKVKTESELRDDYAKWKVSL